MESLNDFELEVLENLPVEPNGLSIMELSEGLLNDCSPKAKGKIANALKRIGNVFGDLHRRVGNDYLDGFGCTMYGIPLVAMPKVRDFCAAISQLRNRAKR